MFVILIEEGYMSIKYESTYEWLHLHYHRNVQPQQLKDNNDSSVYVQKENKDDTTINNELQNTDDLIYPEHEFLYRNYKHQNKEYKCKSTINSNTNFHL